MILDMYNELFNKKEKKTFRQKLRTDPTAAEKQLWPHLQGRQIEGLKFRRQHGIGKYVVDFYCPEIKLIIEVDGDSHFEPGAQEKDVERERSLINSGFRVLRFTDRDIFDSMEDVIEIIKSNLY